MKETTEQQHLKLIESLIARLEQFVEDPRAAAFIVRDATAMSLGDYDTNAFIDLMEIKEARFVSQDIRDQVTFIASAVYELFAGKHKTLNDSRLRDLSENRYSAIMIPDFAHASYPAIRTKLGLMVVR